LPVLVWTRPDIRGYKAAACGGEEDLAERGLFLLVLGTSIQLHLDLEEEAW